MYKFDIKQGYDHLDIKLEHQKYLGFAWEINEKVRYFVSVSPVSLTSTPFLFAKTLRVLVKHWRIRQCQNRLCFFDEQGEMGFPFCKAFASSEFLRNFIIQSGFVVKIKKNLPGTLPQIWFGSE